MAARIAEAFGGIDQLVNNAGTTEFISATQPGERGGCDPGSGSATARLRLGGATRSGCVAAYVPLPSVTQPDRLRSGCCRWVVRPYRRSRAGCERAGTLWVPLGRVPATAR